MKYTGITTEMIPIAMKRTVGCALAFLMACGTAEAPTAVTIVRVRVYGPDQQHSAVVNVGQQIRLRAFGYTANGDSLDLPLAREWSSTAPNVVTILDQNGAISGLVSGQAFVVVQTSTAGRDSIKVSVP